jgi:septal ring factor EnvC (AmiA/AmiB activator)
MDMPMQDETRGFDEFLRLLEEQPALRERLRQLLLTRELLELPRTVAGLAEAVSRLERQVEQLAQAQEKAAERLAAVELRLSALEERVDRLESRVDRLEEALIRLAEAQARTEERVTRLEEAVGRLAEAQARTEERVTRLEEAVGRLAEAQASAEERLARLEEAQIRTEERLARLEEAQIRTEERLARLEEAVAQLAEAQARTEEELRSLARRITDLDGRFTGDYLERRYREHAYSYFAPILRRIRLVGRDRLWELLDEGMEAGIVSPDEARDTALVNVLVEGRTPEGERAFLAVEVSATVYPEDVKTVLRRREVLSRCLDAPVLAAVAGEAIHWEAEEMAQPHLYRVVDGVAVKPGLPAPARAVIRPPR